MDHSQLEYMKYVFLFLGSTLGFVFLVASDVVFHIRGLISDILEERRKTLNMKNKMLLEQQRLENEKIRLLNEINIK